MPSLRPKLSAVWLALALTGVLAAELRAQDAASTQPKDPVRATLLSLALPGGGQLYAGHTVKGLQILAGTAFGAVATIALATERQLWITEPSAPNRAPMFIAGTATALLWLYGVASAADDARTPPPAPQFTVSPALTRAGVGVRLQGSLRF